MRIAVPHLAIPREKNGLQNGQSLPCGKGSKGGIFDHFYALDFNALMATGLTAFKSRSPIETELY